MELSNYAKKADLKRATDYYTSTLASKTDLASLKTKIDDLALDKLKTVPADLSNLSNVENDGVKKMSYKLVTKVSAVDTKMPRASLLITKTHDSDKQGFEESIEGVQKKMSGYFRT